MVMFTWTIRAVAFTAWWLALPYLIAFAFPQGTFATNGRGDGPPVVTIASGTLVLGEGGSPRVHVDWLARRNFRDTRTVNFYEGTALGPNVCVLPVPAPEGGFRDRKGGIQPEEGYSLDRWTNFTLAQCGLRPGTYVAVTEYRVPVLGGLFRVNFELTSNAFEIVSAPITSERTVVQPK